MDYTQKNRIDKLELHLSNYKNIIGIVVIILLSTLIILTVQFFDKQNQIIENCGYTDGKVKCVCTEEAWNAFSDSRQNTKVNFTDFTKGNYSGGLDE